MGLVLFWVTLGVHLVQYLGTDSGQYQLPARKVQETLQSSAMGLFNLAGKAITRSSGWRLKIDQFR